MLPYQKSNVGSTAPVVLQQVSGVSTETGSLANYPKPFSVWENSRKKIRNLRDTWDARFSDAEIRRKKRYYDISTEEERVKKNIASDEFFVPVRKVDTNIRREGSKYIPYLTQSGRDVVIKSAADSSIDCTVIEKDFTNRVRYGTDDAESDDWLSPILKWIDSAQTHALGFCELIFDTRYPGHFLVESIEYENLLFPLDTKTGIQTTPYLIRIVEFTREALADLAMSKGFLPDKIDEILGKNSPSADHSEETSLIPLEKVFFKENGVVMVGWSCIVTVDEGWLKDPEPLFNGKVALETTIDQLIQQPTQQIKEIPETSYPIFLLPYIISENEKLLALKGRVFLDELVQEAATALTSAAITGYKRAAGLYFSSKTASGNSLEEAQTEIRLKQGAVFDADIQSFDLKYPDPSIFNSINAMLSQNDQETASINFAALNRQDSRKTATEVSAAQQEGTLLSVVQVVLFSIAYGKLRRACFDLYKSRSLASLIEIPQQVLALLNAIKKFILKPAGDADFVERQRKVSLMMQTWPVYQATPAASAFLENLTRLLFPEEADQYIQAIRAGDAKNNLLMASKEINSGMMEQLAENPTPENTQKIVQLSSVNKAIDQAVAPPGSPPQEEQSAEG